MDNSWKIVKIRTRGELAYENPEDLASPAIGYNNIEEYYEVLTGDILDQFNEGELYDYEDIASVKVLDEGFHIESLKMLRKQLNQIFSNTEEG